MRITFARQYQDASSGLEQANERLADYQQQVASGKRINRASDDPSDTASAIGERAKMAQFDQYAATGDSANSRLTILDTVMSDIVTKLTAAQSTATSALGTIQTSAQRDAAAQQLDGIKAALVDDFNTSFQGNFLFGGTKSTAKPYPVGAGGVVGAYVGSTTEVQVDIAQNRAVTIGFDGSSVTKGSDPTDLFTTLDTLIAAVKTGDNTAIAAGMTALNNVFTRATAAQSRVGAGMDAIDTNQQRLTSAKLASKTRLSTLEDANMADAISGMQQSDTAYKAALAAAASAGKISLMDYLP
jgi:flagellar hook-associated protein 3 FlgL